MLTITLSTIVVCIGVGILLINTLFCLPTAIGRKDTPWIVLILLTGPFAAFFYSLRNDGELKWLGKLSLLGASLVLLGLAALYLAMRMNAS
ncbi:hypothetical protein R0381_001444 [Jeongeupia wiesaeckerbachi]|uniref:hypothetical protein n=1 Tax=Jeongeupia wiesaeckerbachi TaxID=3051218 RepID=UPI003D804886